MELTPRQFSDRLHDVAEINNMIQGQGKGRVRRDKTRWREFFARTGIKAPEGYQ